MKSFPTYAGFGSDLHHGRSPAGFWLVRVSLVSIASSGCGQSWSELCPQLVWSQEDFALNSSIDTNIQCFFFSCCLLLWLLKASSSQQSLPASSWLSWGRLFFFNFSPFWAEFWHYSMMDRAELAQKPPGRRRKGEIDFVCKSACTGP